MNNSLKGSIILITGQPGTGKTLLGTSLALEINSCFDKECASKMMLIESQHQDFNFPKFQDQIAKEIIKCFSIELKKKNDDKEVAREKIFKIRQSYKKLTGDKIISKDYKKARIINIYDIIYDHFKNETTNGIYKERFQIDYFYWFLTKNFFNRICSNLPIYDKRTGRYSTVFDVSWFSKDNPNPFLPYSTIVYSEADKDLASKNRLTQITNGIIANVNMIGHVTQRKFRLIFDAQAMTAFDPQIRKNCLLFIRMIDEPVLKMPTIFFKILYFIYSKILDINCFIYNTYVSKSVIIPETAKKSWTYLKKRNMNFIKALILTGISFFSKITYHLKKEYGVMHLSTLTADNEEFSKGKKKTIKLNFKDLLGVYNSTFFFNEHLENVMKTPEKIYYRREYEDIYPNRKEIALTKSKFYEEFFNLKKEEETKKGKSKIK